MISVVVYGRNDAHGYNLHRRAALSLNCLAEILTDPDDEIVFVDYNTPDELPTLVKAFSDTLTDRCLELLRVLRVRPAVHAERFAARTHLNVVEPVARNAAARRANPANRWLLSTNTDMVFVPLEGASLSEICRDLPDGFYGLPRFELPEWLWEELPRADPTTALDIVARLGPGLRLNEPTVSHEWIAFDAPGDFQLMLRDDLHAIDGFDEEMLLGWHVDSNLSRRMFLRRGKILSAADRLAGYHCNHNRTPTVYHGARAVANDLNRFFLSVKRPELPRQRNTWGLAEVDLEEVPLVRRTDLAESVREAIPQGPAPPAGSDALGAPQALTYDSGHILPFIADSLVTAVPDTTVAYIGANPILERMLAALIERTQLAGRLEVADLEDPDSLGSLVETADVFVVDLGLDASLVDPSFATDEADESVRFRTKLDETFMALHSLIELERSRLERGEHPHPVVLVNSASDFWNAYIIAQLDCSHTTVHSRVRRATVKLSPDAELSQFALSKLTGEQVVAPIESAVVNTPAELALIEVYRSERLFRTTVNGVIRVGAVVTRSVRGNRPPTDHDETSAPLLVAATEGPSALNPMEGAVIEVYRRRPVFRATVDVLMLGLASARAGRLRRPVSALRAGRRAPARDTDR